jgi:anthranilate synthase component 2
MNKLLVIDNYDSFTYNLVQMFKNYDLQIIVHRSDKITMEQVGKIGPQYILISPGPKDPKNAGISTELVKEFYKNIPILGVCLGMHCESSQAGAR